MINTNVTPPHPVRQLLTRYNAILLAAWAARRELAGPARLADERAFLPAALSLQETPVHPAPRRAAIAIMVLFSITVAWACLSHVDVVAIAHGRIVITDRTKLVQPLENAVIKAIHVKNGDQVSEGQLLVELDATTTQADSKRLHTEKEWATSELLRTQALLKSIDSKKPPKIVSNDDAILEYKEQIDTLLKAEWSDIISKLEKLDADAAHRKAEIRTIETQLNKLQALLPTAQQREQDFIRLAKQGYVPQHDLQDRQREKLELEQDIAIQNARKSEYYSALRQNENERSVFLSETKKNLQNRYNQANLEFNRITEEIIKAEQKNALTRLNSPVSGVVQQLGVHTPGGVVTAAQVLMIIVPSNRNVIAEVQIENKDIGFVSAGQSAEIKIDAFPYTRYGTIPGTLTILAADAVSRDAMQSTQYQTEQDPSPAQANAASAFFPATLELAQSHLNIDGRKIDLSPGLSLTAEIKTGKRRIVEYLFSPLQQYADESMRER